ncbi:hypothetical protein ACS0TY_018677 [Phlomoides rotata]
MEIEIGALWKVDGEWVVKGSVDVDIGANPSAEGADEDEGTDDQAIQVVDIVDTFRLQVHCLHPRADGQVGWDGL